MIEHRDAEKADHNPLPEVAGKSVLFVASTGGHLEQLVMMTPLMEVSASSRWVTFDTPQARSLLVGKNATFVPYVASRDWKSVLRAASILNRSIDWNEFEAVVSTGAAVALSALPLARLRRIPTFYIESVSRFDGPSMTGKIVSRARLARTFTQHPEWASARWPFRFSLLNSYKVRTRSTTAPQRMKVLVTLGTIKPFRFDSMVDAVLRALPPSAEVTWQLGSTLRSDLPGTTHESVSVSEFERLATDSDVVVSHAGVGSTLRLLELGISPILIPRRKARREHVDDHQLQVATRLAKLGLVDMVAPDDLSEEHLTRATSRGIERA